jgi:hypothetical protein
MFCNWLVTRFAWDLCFSLRSETESCCATQGGRSVLARVANAEGRKKTRRESFRHVTQPTWQTEAWWSWCFPASPTALRARLLPHRRPQQPASCHFLEILFSSEQFYYYFPLWPLITRFLGATVSHWPACNPISFNALPIFCTLSFPGDLFFYSEGSGSRFLQNVGTFLPDYTTLYRWRKQYHLSHLLYAFLDKQRWFKTQLTPKRLQGHNLVKVKTQEERLPKTSVSVHSHTLSQKSEQSPDQCPHSKTETVIAEYCKSEGQNRMAHINIRHAYESKHI